MIEQCGLAGKNRLANQIANRINNNASINDDVRAIANRRMVSGNLQYSLGSVLIHSKEEELALRQTTTT